MFSVMAEEVGSGAGTVSVTRYRPAASEPSATVVYLHSGGWVLGSVAAADPLVRRLAQATGCEYVSVEYRLAPEHRFPAALHDAVTVLSWAAGLGRALIVHGDSAGGNLAAAATLVARDAGGPEIALQMLVYPVCDHDLTRDSYVHRGDAGLLKGADMRWFWDHYADPAQRDDPLASPLRAESLHGLPPAVVIVAEFDPLRDEGLAYARRLTEAGVPVDLRVYDDVCHGFFSLGSEAPRAVEAAGVVAAAIRDVT
jgi:acetyl esterase